MSGKVNEKEAGTLNIYQKVAKIRKKVEFMSRDTRAYGYSYTKEADILAKVVSMMDLLSLSLVPRIVPGTTTVVPYSYKKTKSTSSGKIYEEIVNEILTQADMVYTWVNNDRPEETIEVPWAMVGQQSDASQSFGSGMTYSSRYFLLKYFNIASDNDPDKYRASQRQVEDEEKAEILTQTIDAISAMASRMIKSAKDDQVEIVKRQVKDVCAKYTPSKSGNYFSIKNQVDANELLNELTKLCGEQSE